MVHVPGPPPARSSRSSHARTRPRSGPDGSGAAGGAGPGVHVEELSGVGAMGTGGSRGSFASSGAPDLPTTHLLVGRSSHWSAAIPRAPVEGGLPRSTKISSRRTRSVRTQTAGARPDPRQGRRRPPWRRRPGSDGLGRRGSAGGGAGPVGPHDLEAPAGAAVEGRRRRGPAVEAGVVVGHAVGAGGVAALVVPPGGGAGGDGRASTDGTSSCRGASPVVRTRDHGRSVGVAP